MTIKFFQVSKYSNNLGISSESSQRRLQLETEIDQLRRRIEYNQEVLEKRDKEIGNLERQLQRAKSDSRTAESELRHLREIDENSSKIRYFKIRIFGGSTQNPYFRKFDSNSDEFRGIHSKSEFSGYRLKIRIFGSSTRKLLNFKESIRSLNFRSIELKSEFSENLLENFGESTLNLNLATMFSNWKMKNVN